MPGLEAVYENFYGSWRFSKLTGSSNVPYLGAGTLDNDGVCSPTQAILDTEIRKSQFYLKNKIGTNEQTPSFEEICERIKDGKDFFSSDHTLKHFRDLWSSNIFLTEKRTEKDILDKCDEMWRENIKNYQPPEWPKEKIKALEDILKRAKKRITPKLKRNMRNYKIVRIEGRRFKIRRLQEEDKRIFYEFFQALSKKTKNFFHPHPFDKKTAEKLCDEDDLNIIRFIAVEEVNGKEKVAGYTFLARINEDFPGLGIGGVMPE